MEWIDKKTIKLNRELSELDKFVLKFIRILEEYTNYVLISGYVSILLGRSRSTEDVDVFIEPLTKENFIKLYHELRENNFWCLNAESDDEVYSYLQEGISIRFAEKGEVMPNMEVKFAKRLLDLEVFNDYLEVKTEKGTLKISSLERQIAFKRYYLSSDKDIEDAKHLEEVFKEKINQEKINKYKFLITEHEKT
ncbi:MAG: hypothetical protein ABIA37_02545 [Candidatus Woesearchaeota archaeon]